MKSNITNKILTLLFILFFASCNQSKETSLFAGYKQLGDKLFFKYEALPLDDVFPNKGDLLVVKLSYSFYPSDSVFFEGIRKFRLTIPKNPNSIEHALFKLSKGDSASIILNVNNFFNNDLDTTVPHYLANHKWMIIRLKILDVIPYEQFVSRINNMLSWIKKLKPQSYILDTFLNKIELFEKRGGIVKILIDSGNGKKIEYGDTIFINYEGFFFDGKIFDSTYKTNIPLSFVYGDEHQVIKAFEIVLKKMEEKEKSLYIVPPELAFGSKGVTGIIPPYEPLVFVLKVDSVKKNINK